VSPLCNARDSFDASAPRLRRTIAKDLSRCKTGLLPMLADLAYLKSVTETAENNVGIVALCTLYDWFCLCVYWLSFYTNYISWKDKAIGNIRPFVFTLSFEPTTFELKFLCMWVMTIAHLGLKVKVISPGHSSACVGLIMQ